MKFTIMLNVAPEGDSMVRLFPIGRTEGVIVSENEDQTGIVQIGPARLPFTPARNPSGSIFDRYIVVKADETPNA